MNSTAPIVAGIDFSAPSAAVLRHAIHAANLTSAPVIAVHVLDSGILSHRIANVRSNHGIEPITAQARRKLEEMVASHADGANVRIEVRCGRPADELTAVIKDSGAGLLVIAANDLTKKRLGSIASRCVRSAPCDVMVLRDWQDENFLKIVVCADFSPTAALALARGIDLAAAHAAALEIVHVMYPPSRDVWGEVLDHKSDSATSYAEECHNQVQDEVAAFIGPFKDRLASILYEVVILESVVPSVALTHHVQDTHADLVVLGTRGLSRIAGLFLGTNAERLLHDAGVSVLAVRD
jgi:universal stress protein E